MKNMQILVVDDDRDFAESFAELLQVAGHDSSVATSGSAAIHRLRNQRFDAAFVDIKMPTTGGMTVLHEIRDAGLRVKMVPMTGFGIVEIVREAVGNRPVATVRGPVAHRIVLEKISDVLPDGVVVVADDNPGFTRDLTIEALEFGYHVEPHMQSSARMRQDPDASALADAPIEPSVKRLTIIDTGGTLVEELEDYMDLLDRGVDGPAVIVLRRRLDRTVAGDPFRTPAVTGCIFKPFDPLAEVEQLYALGS
jgi:two-component system response regulator HydG